jgi:hypothetical protein
MSNEEAQKVLNELQSVRPEMLNGEAKRLFEAIMKIADQRDELKKTCYTMAEYIVSRDIDEDICKYINCGEGDKEREECIECVINYFKNK